MPSWATWTSDAQIRTNAVSGTQSILNADLSQNPIFLSKFNLLCTGLRIFSYSLLFYWRNPWQIYAKKNKTLGKVFKTPLQNNSLKWKVQKHGAIPSGSSPSRKRNSWEYNFWAKVGHTFLHWETWVTFSSDTFVWMKTSPSSLLRFNPVIRAVFDISR